MSGSNEYFTSDHARTTSKSPPRGSPSQGIPVENIRQTKMEHLSQGPLPIRIAKILVDGFQGTGKRGAGQGRHEDLLTSRKSEHVRLITIGISHYCEKARWALDLLEADSESPIYYTEDAHPPALAAFVTVPASRGEASMTPMVVFDDEKHPAVFDSTNILRNFTPFLYPEKKAKEIEEFEEYLDAHLGPTVRCFAYNVLLKPENHDVVGNIATAHTSYVERILFKAMLTGGLASGMTKAMDITTENAQKSLSEIRSVFHVVSSQLSDGRQYLFDDNNEKIGFTAADLTFAALASPLVMPKELMCLQMNRDQIPPKICSVVEELRSTPAGKHALTIYHKHRFGKSSRPRSSSSCAMAFPKVVPKSVGRNRGPLSFPLVLGALAFGLGCAAVRSRL